MWPSGHCLSASELAFEAIFSDHSAAAPSLPRGVIASLTAAGGAGRDPHDMTIIMSRERRSVGDPFFLTLEFQFQLGSGSAGLVGWLGPKHK